MSYININKNAKDDFYQMFFDNLSDMITINVRGPDGKFVYVSDQFLKRLNLKPNDLEGKGSTELIKENLYDTSSSERAFLTGQNSKDYFHASDDKWVYSESKIVRDKQNKMQYVITYCIVPDDVSKEVNKLRKNLDHYKKEAEYLRDFLMKEGKEPVFACDDMHKMLEKAKKVAPSDANVLITGESGVGKEVVAQTIHNNSNRADKPFVPVCIPQISPSLLESELFGYEKGAFTGASHSGRPGLLEKANGGTVFLDEIGDVPIDLQVKLLRVLETHEITRVGGTANIKLDIRFLAATNKDLKCMVENGKFREDLFYRINVIHFHIKPLRERKDDIIPLANYFISVFEKNYGMSYQLSDEVYLIFLQYSWPGNVRELRNIIEKLVILSDDTYITANTLHSIIEDEDLITSDKTLLSYPSKQPETSESSIVAEYNHIERQRILNALIEANGNRKVAAEKLGISRSTLYRYLQEKMP